MLRLIRFGEMVLKDSITNATSPIGAPDISEYLVALLSDYTGVDSFVKIGGLIMQ